MIIDKMVLLPTQTKHSKTIYSKLGYDTSNDYTLVKFEDVPKKSPIEIKMKCDNKECNKIFFRKRRCIISYDDGLGDLCNECSQKIRAGKSRKIAHENNIKKDPDFNKKVQEKRIKTNLEKYGTEYACQNKEIIEKQKKTYLSNHTEYPFERKEIQNKIKNTMQNKYGGYPMQVPEFLQKAQNTNLKKYGNICSACNQEIKNKQMQTMLKNNTVPTSSQQIEVYNILKKHYTHCIINKPLSNIFLDCEVCVNNIMIDVEYDGRYWHQDSVHDRKRDEFVKSNGYKVLRIKSNKLIPNENDLIKTIEKLSLSNHSYNEIILDDWQS